MSNVAGLDLEKLFDAARLEVDEDSPAVPHLVELQRRGTREIFDRSLNLLKSSQPSNRVLGIRIIRELGGIPPTFATEARPCLIGMVANEHHPSVLRWLISAIGYQYVGHQDVSPQQRQEAIRALMPFVEHDDELVRLSVAAALPGLIGPAGAEPQAIELMLRLASDSVADVRYYAFAGLTDELLLTKHEQVLAALQQATADADPQIRQAANRVLRGGTWGEP